MGLPASNGDGQPLLREVAPPGIEAAIAGWLQPDEARQFLVSSDVTPDGNYGSVWLLATDQRIALLHTDDGRPVQVEELRLDELEEIRRLDFVGLGALRLETPTRATELRFSLSLSDKFDDLREALEALRRSRVPQPEEEGGGATPLTEEALRSRMEERARKRGRCARCGQTLPRGTSVCPSCLKKTQLLLRLFGYVRPYWGWSLISLVLMFLVTASNLLPPHLTKILIDEVFVPDLATGRIPAANNALLLRVALALLIVAAVSAFIGAARQYLVTWLGQRIILDMRGQVYRHVHQLSLSFYDRKSTGALIYRMTGDIDRLQGFLANGLQQILSDAAMVLIITGYLFVQHSTLAAITLIPVPLIVWLSRRFGVRIYRMYHKIWRKASRMHAMMGDALPGARVVKAFTQEQREVDRFLRLNEELMAGNLRAAMMARTFYPSLSFLTMIGRMVVWVYGGQLVIRHYHPEAAQALTPGLLIAFIQYLASFYGPVERLSQLNDQFVNAATSAERVFELIDTRLEIEDAADAVPLPTIEGRVTFDRVTFSYEPGVPVLHEVSFDVRPGEMIGLVGASGAGKTTLINLLCRFYDVKDGRILIDGHDVRLVTVRSLRDQIGVVLQEPYLFHGTIAENIAYGKPEAALEEIMAAALVANAHEFIVQLPDGYDTMVGERGVRLSGGEKQRISIARAVLKNPRILILDEATSSVDSETEAQIREAMERLIADRTTFAIAHRFSTLRSAHRVMVMEKGRVVESGTHAELLALEDGVFARLCRLQADMAKTREDHFLIEE